MGNLEWPRPEFQGRGGAGCSGCAGLSSIPETEEARRHRADGACGLGICESPNLRIGGGGAATISLSKRSISSTGMRMARSVDRRQLTRSAHSAHVVEILAVQPQPCCRLANGERPGGFCRDPGECRGLTFPQRGGQHEIRGDGYRPLGLGLRFRESSADRHAPGDEHEQNAADAKQFLSPRGDHLFQKCLILKDFRHLIFARNPSRPHQSRGDSRPEEPGRFCRDGVNAMASRSFRSPKPTRAEEFFATGGCGLLTPRLC